MFVNCSNYYLKNGEKRYYRYIDFIEKRADGSIKIVGKIGKMRYYFCGVNVAIRSYNREVKVVKANE